MRFFSLFCFGAGPTAHLRRQFLRGIAMAVVAAALPWRAASAAPAFPLPLDPASARAVGRRYLELAPAEADRSYLLELLSLPDPRLDIWPERQDLLHHLETLRDREFFAGDSVLIDGWVLSRSEARICALHCL